MENRYSSRRKYSLLEKLYIQGGSVLGVIAPIIAGRVMIFNNNSNDLYGELLAWGHALILSAGPMVVAPYLAVSSYGFLAGRTLGNVAANISQRNRVGKGLEKI